MPEILSLIEQDMRRAARPATELGRRGERLAAEFLEASGYRLVLSNFTVPIGRNNRGATVTGEIDLVAVDDDVLCFVEVKTRTSDEFAAPTATVNRRKQRQIIRAARVYRRIFGLTEVEKRFDVVSIVLSPKGDAKIELIKDFWSETIFRKKRWSGDFY